MIRILLVADASSANVQSFSSGLESEGFAVELASFEPGTRGARLRPAVPGSIRYLLSVPSVRAIARRVAPDLVIGYFASGYGTLARLSGRRPLVQVVAGSDILKSTRNPGVSRFVKRNLSSADLVLAWSEHLAEAASGLGASEDSILVQPRGVDIQRFRPAQAPPTEPRLITTRAFRPQYRHEILLDALGGISDDWHLTMVGEGPEVPRLRDHSSSFGDRVAMPGSLKPDDLAIALRTHSIYVSMCLSDGVSASLLEAMATGLFPLVVDNRANRAWIETGTNGMLYDGSVEDLTRVLRTAMGDRDLWVKARQLNRELVLERADVHKNMAVIGDHLRALVGR